MQLASRLIVLFVILNIYSIANAQSSSANIKVNQVGYLIGHSKVAWLSNSSASYGEAWHIKNASSGQTIFTSSLIDKPVYDAASGDTLLKLDFTSLEIAGSYYVEVDNLGASYPFIISDTTYNNLFKDLVRSYYYQRCGEDLVTANGGIWSRPACHANDGYIYGGYSGGSIISGAYVPSTGGWHDAGDFGKKIVPASMALYHLLKLVELFPSTVNSIPLNLPSDTFSMPDLLKEAKYELDWFFSLQFANGSVSHLITSANFAEQAMPDKDEQTRYLVPASSAATADFAAVMAIASKVYKPYSAAYAAKCLSASQNAWAYIQATPTIAPAGGYTVDPPGINNTGTYFDTSDVDERLWASAELFNTTSDSVYRKYFETHYSYWNPEVDYPSSWPDVHGYAMYTYCFATSSEKTNTIREAIVNDIVYYTGLVVNAINTTGYGIALRPSDYYWGSNQLVGSYGVDLIRTYLLHPDTTYLEAALSHLSYLLGNNPLNLCYVTGHGTNSTKDPLQVPSIYDGIAAPVPGFLAGGPNQYSDAYDILLNNYISANHPAPAKCYLDNHASYSSNEVCVTYTAPALFMAGYFSNSNVGATTAIINKMTKSNSNGLKSYPNPFTNATSISFNLTREDYINLELIDFNGRIVQNLVCGKQEPGIHNINCTVTLPAGIYICKLSTSSGIEAIKLVVY